MINKIRKRDGREVVFKKLKIIQAIHKAFQATNSGSLAKARVLAGLVEQSLSQEFKKNQIPNIEDIQDAVENILMENNYKETAKAYILYRDQHREIREISEATSLVDNYLTESDWRVKENSNMAYSLQGLNNHIASIVTAKYWLEKIYPENIRKAHESGEVHIHDLSTLSAYCCGWSLEDLLIRGFGGVPGKIESRPAKHFQTALGQAVNFIYTLQGEVAGAQAFSSFDTLFAPFIRYDQLSYPEIKQSMQEFLYNMNVPTRVGFQTPFSNITMDLTPPKLLGNERIIIGGERQKEKYKDFQEEMDMINKAFAEVMLEGDASGRVFTFPIPTYNISHDFNWNNPVLKPVWAMTAKYGIPYFANFINSDMDPDDARSMCCRLRLDNRELLKRGGGLFGAYPLTGSCGVVTINMARIGYLSKTEKAFLQKVEDLMNLAKESLEIKRKVLEKFTNQGLYPYSKHYLESIKKVRNSYWANHFSTVGLVGMNEALINFMNQDIASEKGRRFAMKILDAMRARLVMFQEQTGNIYNLEATPAEGTSYRLAKIDRAEFKDIITAGNGEPYYTNSTHLPVNHTDDIFEALQLQDNLQIKYTGGTVLHGFLGEQINNEDTTKNLVKKIAENFSLPYFTITPTFSICPNHGYLSGEHKCCPKCVIKQPCEIYSRVVGYLRPVQQWHKGKQEEFKDRLAYNHI